MVSKVAHDIMVFTGNANPDLAQDIIRHLDIPLGQVRVGIPGKYHDVVRDFADHWIRCWVG